MFSITKSNIARYTLVAGFAFAMVSCKKDEEPEPRIGSIAGSVNPESTESVRVMNAGNQVLFTVKPASNGRFTFGHLNAGDYTVKVTPKAGFGIPAAIKVPVVGNETTELGDIEVERNAFAKITVTNPGDGSVVTVADSGSIIVSDFNHLDSTFTLQTLPVMANGRMHSVTLMVENFTGANTYNMVDFHRKNPIAAARYDVSGLTPWTSQITGGGKVTVTSYDAATGLMSGTFNFTASKPASGTTPDLRTLSGEFTNVYVDME